MNALTAMETEKKYHCKTYSVCFAHVDSNVSYTRFYHTLAQLSRDIPDDYVIISIDEVTGLNLFNLED